MDVGDGARRSRRPKHAGRLRAVLIVVGVVAGAALIWLAVSLTHQPAGKGGGPGGRGGRPSTTVGVATATTADVPITLDALGTVTPAATVTVSPQVSGVITEILFREGQIVRRGQTLAVIDPRPLRNALTQAEGQLIRDEAQLANARLLLQRNRTLLAQDSIARQDVDTQAALVRQLEGTVTIDRGAVAQARLNLGFSQVAAPVSGRVGLRVVDEGNYIAAGSATGLVVITEISPADVEFTVPQDDIPRITQQAQAGRLPVAAYDRTRTIVLDQGVFSTLDNQVDTTTGTVKAKASFPNTAGKLFPNQFVNVRISLQTLRGAVVVPVTAIRTGQDGDFVWKLNPDRTVTRRNVTRGPATAQQASITSGLAAGEKVITEGGDRLTDGARVTLPGDRPQGGRRGRRAAGGSNSATPPAPEAGNPAGGFQPSPEMRAARQAAMTACAADLQKLCAGQSGREAFTCLRGNQEAASPACRAAIGKMPRRQAAPGG